MGASFGGSAEVVDVVATSNRGKRTRSVRGIRINSFLRVVTMALLVSPSHGQSSDDVYSLEYRVKAAFLYNFAKFVEWPSASEASGSDRFALCVLGADPFGPILDETVSGKSVQGKPLEVRRVETAAAAMTCQVVFISSSERSQISTIVEVLSTAAVLTVSEIPGFAERGGMVNFVLHHDRVQFEINPHLAGKVGLHISSHLLRLARTVCGKSGRRQ